MWAHSAITMHRFSPHTAPTKGPTYPVATSSRETCTRCLNAYGAARPRLTLILFNLDEDTYARELAPLAGHYPAIKIGDFLGWFHDSVNGMRRYFDRVMETAGIYNTAGFNDDTRAFHPIARHDVWRRTAANWVAGLIVQAWSTAKMAAIWSMRWLWVGETGVPTGRGVGQRRRRQ